MHIGVFSDLHDNIANLRKLLALFTDRRVQHDKRIGDCLWLNPGEVMGWRGRATCALYDTTTNTAQIIEL